MPSDQQTQQQTTDAPPIPPSKSTREWPPLNIATPLGKTDKPATPAA